MSAPQTIHTKEIFRSFPPGYIPERELAYAWMGSWLESRLQKLKDRGTNVDRELTSEVLVFAQENDNFCDVYWQYLKDDEKFCEGLSEAYRQIGAYFKDYYLDSAESAPFSSVLDVLCDFRMEPITDWMHAHGMSYGTLWNTFNGAVPVNGMEKPIEAKKDGYWEIFVKGGVPQYLYKGDAPSASSQPPFRSDFREIDLCEARFTLLAPYVQQDTSGALWVVNYIRDPVTLGGVFAFGMHNMARNEWSHDVRKKWASSHLAILIHAALHMTDLGDPVECAAQAIQTFWEYLIPLYEHSKRKGEEDRGPSMMQRVVSDSLRERSRQP